MRGVIIMHGVIAIRDNARRTKCVLRLVHSVPARSVINLKHGFMHCE